MTDTKVLIGMSGGVDSSTAAYLMKQAGYNCVGGTALFWEKEGSSDLSDAASIARRLDIPFHTFDLREDFLDKVVNPFIRTYEEGRTPNPCIFCNRFLKFDRLLEAAKDLGCTHIASGHYARIRRDTETGRYLLLRAMDRTKDQSYFLACLSQEQLSRIFFPLGELTKAEVRQIAQDQGFVTARKRDSQDICFVPGGDYVTFMEGFTGKTYPAGDYLDLEGNVVGRHRGAVCYTLGQRKGLGIALGAPAYVCGKDMARNTVTVGPQEALFSSGLIARDWTWFPFPELTEPLRVTARTRHSQTEQPATVCPLPDGEARVEFDTPQRAITPGQAVVLYMDEVVVGGGTIIRSFL